MLSLPTQCSWGHPLLLAGAPDSPYLGSQEDFLVACQSLHAPGEPKALSMFLHAVALEVYKIS